MPPSLGLEFEWGERREEIFRWSDVKNMCTSGSTRVFLTHSPPPLALCKTRVLLCGSRARARPEDNRTTRLSLFDAQPGHTRVTFAVAKSELGRVGSKWRVDFAMVLMTTDGVYSRLPLVGISSFIAGWKHLRPARAVVVRRGKPLPKAENCCMPCHPSKTKRAGTRS